ncbi:MAG: hypothetical protein FJ388_10925 [Verrucomicrobia bacterium]|nr:hypothetical protein [Verrucomicrobiota bacterium]
MKEKASSSVSQFWTGGHDAHLKALAKKEVETLAPLEARLEAATDPAGKSEIEEEIKAVKKLFREKRRRADGSLFFGAGTK